MQLRVLVRMVRQAYSALPMPLIVVSTPAERNERTSIGACSRIDLAGVGGLVDLVAEAARPQLLALAVLHDPLRHRPTRSALFASSSLRGPMELKIMSP